MYGGKLEKKDLMMSKNGSGLHLKKKILKAKLILLSKMQKKM